VHPDTPGRGTSLPASATITGADGAVLATISRHSEHPVPEPTGSSGQAPLIVVDAATPPDDPRLIRGGVWPAFLDRTADVVHEIRGHAAAVCLLLGMLLLTVLVLRL
jgi:hypothetical protein